MCETQKWQVGEPALDDLLDDPIVTALLRRDGLTRRDVWRAVAQARARLRRARPADVAA